MLITMHPSNIQTKFLYEEEGSNIMHKCYLFTKVNFSFFTFFVLVRDFFIHQLNPIRPGFNLRNLNCCLTSKHENKNWSKSQKVSEILRVENVMDLKFCRDLTHEMAVTCSIFKIEGSSFGLFLIFMCLRNHI